MPDRVVVFDAYCLLCSKFIRILLNNDNGQLTYTGFESGFAKTQVPERLLNDPETVIFYENGSITLKSRAVFAILKYTRRRLRWLRLFRFLPTTFTDLLYDWLARNRYAWFGRSEECYLPTEDQKKKFLA